MSSSLCTTALFVRKPVSITKQSVRAGDSGAPLGTPNLDYFRGMLTLTALRLQIGEEWKSHSYSKHLLAQFILNPLAYGVPNPMLLYIGAPMLFVGISLRHPESRDLSCTIRTTTSECRLRGFLSRSILRHTSLLRIFHFQLLFIGISWNYNFLTPVLRVDGLT